MPRPLLPIALIVLLTFAGVLPAQVDAPRRVRYDGHRIVHVELENAEQLDFMMSLPGARVLSCRTGVGPLDFVLSPKALAAIEASGIAHQVVHENAQALIDAERARIGEGGVAGPITLCDDAWFSDYKTLNAINTRIDQLVAAHPDLVEKITLGNSLQDRPVHGMRITAPGGPADRPAVLFDGCQHAREWVAPMVPMYIATRLACGWEQGDPQIQALLEEIEFFIVPVVNPDGYEYSWLVDRFWRKNRRDNGGGVFGVDLNRNWSIDWNGGQSTSTSPDSETYVGTGPFSEPETQLMRDFVIANPHIAAHIDFHSYQQIILQSWSHTNTLPPDYAAINALGEAMHVACADVHGVNYPHGSGGSLLYLASGVFPDWSYGTQGIFAYTIELRPADVFGGGFELPPSQILPTAEENFAAAMAMSEWVAAGVQFTFPGGLPAVSEPWTGTPIAVHVTPTSSGAIESVEISYHIDDGPIFTEPMTSAGGTLYTAELPGAACGSTITFSLEAQAESGAIHRSPAGAPADGHLIDVIEEVQLFADDFESDLGWTVENLGSLTDGAWERGVPAGGGDRGDPAFDADGSGQCYLTDNVDGNSDVDSGTTVLTSPALDADNPGALIAYHRWYTNHAGSNPGKDSMIVEVSDDDGASWTVLEVVSASVEAWTHRMVPIADYVEPSAMFRIRFVVGDEGNGSVVEAAVDGVRVLAYACTHHPADVNFDGAVNVDDLVAVILAWGPCPPPGVCPPDINGDGAVNVDDLIEVILGWG